MLCGGRLANGQTHAYDSSSMPFGSKTASRPRSISTGISLGTVIAFLRIRRRRQQSAASERCHAAAHLFSSPAARMPETSMAA